METHTYDLASPAIPDWDHVHMRPNRRCVARDVNYVDILFAVFTRPAWECWKYHINTTLNRMGWGYDVTFRKLCNARVGILDTQIAIWCKHSGEKSDTFAAGGGKHRTERMRMRNSKILLNASRIRR